MSKDQTGKQPTTGQKETEKISTTKTTNKQSDNSTSFFATTSDDSCEGTEYVHDEWL